MSLLLAICERDLGKRLDMEWEPVYPSRGGRYLACPVCFALVLGSLEVQEFQPDGSFKWVEIDMKAKHVQWHRGEL